jgi:hypothetical protein
MKSPSHFRVKGKLVRCASTVYMLPHALSLSSLSNSITLPFLFAEFNDTTGTWGTARPRHRTDTDEKKLSAETNAEKSKQGAEDGGQVDEEEMEVVRGSTTVLEVTDAPSDDARRVSLEQSVKSDADNFEDEEEEEEQEHETTEPAPEEIQGITESSVAADDSSSSSSRKSSSAFGSTYDNSPKAAALANKSKSENNNSPRDDRETVFFQIGRASKAERATEERNRLGQMSDEMRAKYEAEEAERIVHEEKQTAHFKRLGTSAGFNQNAKKHSSMDKGANSSKRGGPGRAGAH